MSLWGWVLAASLIGLFTKLAGYLLPISWVEQPRVMQLTSAMTIGLLSSLVMLNAVGSGQHLVLDARLVALAVAAVALWRGAPYLAVVVLGAVAAALARLAGIA
ncbi:MULTISPECIES: AzlD domain-containing protein [unclassified Luteococcus]|uniref:AzlD domain-containing protein n=1 Tax=unclassified Luteococcus TaxID=2639923 RepID=UPI00313AAD4A